MRYRRRSTTFASGDNRGTGLEGGTGDRTERGERMRYYSRRTHRLTILTGLNLFGSRSHNVVSVTRSCALTAKNSGSKRRHGAPTLTSRLRSSRSSKRAAFRKG